MQKLAIEPVWFTSREYLESQYVGHWSLILTECCSETGDQRERREPGRGGISQSFSPFIFSKIFFCAYPTCPAFSIPFLIQVNSTTATHAPAATVPIDVFNKSKQKKREATAVGSCNTRLTDHTLWLTTDHTLWPHSLTTLSLTHATTVDDGGCRQGVNIKGRTIWPPPLTFQHFVSINFLLIVSYLRRKISLFDYEVMYLQHFLSRLGISCRILLVVIMLTV